MKYLDIVNNGKDELKSCGIEDFANDSWLIFEHVFKMNRTSYFMRQMEENTDKISEEEYKKLIDIRKKRIPLQHITGHQEFMGFDFKVNENTLIPRQDTEILVEKTIEIVKNCEKTMPEVLDMCTGSGCIAVSIAKNMENAKITASDVSKEALAVAQENIRIHNAKNVNIIYSDLFENIEGKFDVIVSNPPYIKTAIIEELEDEVKLHDPFMALDGMEDGLFFYREITKKAVSFLNNGGYLLYEIGHDQADDVLEMLIESGFTQVTVLKDYANLDRVVFGRLDLPF